MPISSTRRPEMADRQAKAARSGQQAAIRAALDAYESARDAEPGLEPGWLAALRDRAMARFTDVGIPDRRIEAWRWTDLRRLAETPFRSAPRVEGPLAAAAAEAFAGVTCDRAVFVNGWFRADLSRLDGLPAGAELRPLGPMLREAPAALEAHLAQGDAEAADRPFLALNTALWRDGLFLHLGRGVRLTRPLHVLHLCAGGEGEAAPLAFHPRLIVIAEAQSEAVLLESHMGPDGVGYFANHVATITLGDGAQLHHGRLQREGEGAFHFAHDTIRMGRDARYRGFVMALGAGLARHEVDLRFEGPGGEGHVGGVYTLDGARHFDATIAVDHAVPDCRSRQVFKGVLEGTSRSVFQGRIRVRPDAQRSDGHQLAQALLLSPGAEADAKPELDIQADDVKCSHGAAIGQLDADALFYLRARGIDEAAARALLVNAFLEQALMEIEREDIRDAFAAMLRRRLAPQADRIA